MICSGCRTSSQSLKQFGWVFNNNAKRYLSSVATAPVNHYKTLGLSSKATQSEIKSAYYKLSKVFHPDVNGQNEEAAVKFRQITAAYEVLGNIKLRKMYDRGLLPRESTFYPDTTGEDFEEKKPSSPYKRTRSQPMTGRTEHYNFDEWARLHYGYAMNRKQTAKASKAAQEAQRIDLKAESQTDKLLALVVIGILTLFGLNYAGHIDSDVPPRKST